MLGLVIEMVLVLGLVIEMVLVLGLVYLMLLDLGNTLLLFYYNPPPDSPHSTQDRFEHLHPHVGEI